MSFFWVNLQSNSKTERILMEEGTKFENKGATYTMNSDGNLSIFDKNTQKKKTGNTISLTNYQYQTFKAVVNNSKDGKKVDALSNKDIELALNKYSQGKLKNDLSEFLEGDYIIKNPKIFTNEKKFSAYVTNGNKNVSAVLAFQYDVNTKENKKVEPVVTPKVEPIKNDSKVSKKAFTGSKLFSNENIIEKKAYKYTVKKGDDLVSIAIKHEIDTYQLIAANPQLKAGTDYKVIYPKGKLAELKTLKLPPNTKIIIPARYKVKADTCKNMQDVATITGVNKSFLKDFLTKVETHRQSGKPDLVAYYDDGGTPTIGFGHTGRVNGKPISAKKGKETRITTAQAYQILAEDILKHKAMTMAYLGKNNYLSAPRSVQDAILDVAYNKGIWDGYLTNRGFANSTCKIKDDLKNKHYASALVHTKREKTGFRGLRKRNIYRFISGLRDLPADKQKAAMKAMKPYYEAELKKCRGIEKIELKKAWENAEKGITTGYTLR